MYYCFLISLILIPISCIIYKMIKQDPIDELEKEIVSLNNIKTKSKETY